MKRRNLKRAVKRAITALRVKGTFDVDNVVALANARAKVPFDEEEMKKAKEVAEELLKTVIVIVNGQEYKFLPTEVNTERIRELAAKAGVGKFIVIDEEGIEYRNPEEFPEAPYGTFRIVPYDEWG